MHSTGWVCPVQHTETDRQTYILSEQFHRTEVSLLCTCRKKDATLVVTSFNSFLQLFGNFICYPENDFKELEIMLQLRPARLHFYLFSSLFLSFLKCFSISVFLSSLFIYLFISLFHSSSVSIILSFFMFLSLFVSHFLSYPYL